MQVKKAQANHINKYNNRQNFQGVSSVAKTLSSPNSRKLLRTLANPDALTSTVLLETAVTGGRSYNAYKRGGKNELRERFIDDVVSAVFWLKGVDIFNGIGNWVGKNVLHLPTTEFDVGKDALRTPFENLVSDKASTVVNSKQLEKKLAGFKFTKIILSTLAATAFVGFALPKLNQAFTKMLFNKDKSKKIAQQKETINTSNKMYKPVSMAEFEKKISDKKMNASFKGFSPDKMATIAHYLENNKVCKLLSSDVGILSGRVATARNIDEGIEYLFRDSASSFFYLASTPLIYSGLQKLTKSSATTSIDPVAAKQLHEALLNQLKDSQGNFASINADDFLKKTIGSLDDVSKDFLEKLPFESDVISFDKLKRYIFDGELLEKASKMAKLQPEKAGVGAVLTKQQVSDVLKKGSINTPEFMQAVYKEKFGEALTDRYKYIPMKQITTFRDNIDDYVNAVVDAAKNTDDKLVTKELLDKISKKSFIKSAGFRTVAIGISALALGIAIPKLQYLITKIRTGSSAAPGLREFEETQQTQTKKN